jgi:isoleucyl-tRNA synthetase
VDPQQMSDLDRYVLHTLQGLVEKCRRAYDYYEFHIIYHALHNYCAVDLSAFYLDILKDRLYTSPAGSRERRSAQTVLYRLLDAIVRMMAPILSFTAEEIWTFMPVEEGREESVHLAGLPAMDADRLDNDLAERWRQLRTVRGEVTRAIETARTDKKVGHSLDAAVTLYLDESLHAAVAPYEEELRFLLIVSQAALEKGAAPENAWKSDEVEGVAVVVAAAVGEKCPRCWVRDASLAGGVDPDAVCPRCRKALDAIAANESEG